MPWRAVLYCKKAEGRNRFTRSINNRLLPFPGLCYNSRGRGASMPSAGGPPITRPESVPSQMDTHPDPRYVPPTYNPADYDLSLIHI